MGYWRGGGGGGVGAAGGGGGSQNGGEVGGSSEDPVHLILYGAGPVLNRSVWWVWAGEEWGYASASSVDGEEEDGEEVGAAEGEAELVEGEEDGGRGGAARETGLRGRYSAGGGAAASGNASFSPSATFTSPGRWSAPHWDCDSGSWLYAYTASVGER
ncbi:glycine-rich protein 1-like [Hetaerina americana]|uniref:glycine-rich protein 1-like n=1 Tax=Hetaerina americana TaxID=62018 RepID=UPI003A7F2EE9